MKAGLRLFALGWLLAALWLPGAAGAQSRALLIGISQYAEIDSLRYADADVKAFSEILTDFAGYRRSDVTVILNRDATKARIQDEISKVVRASEKRPLEHFILMFAGHGVPSRFDGKETHAFLAPYDASTQANTFYSTTKGEVENESFINRAWLARQLALINAKSIVIVLDSCYSGTKSFGDLFIDNMGFAVKSFAASGSSRGVAVLHEKQTRNLVISAQAGSLGTRKVAYLASARDDQAAAEYDELRHGALSYAMFESIKRARSDAYEDDRTDLSVESVYAEITRTFREFKVQGRALDELHQPFLLPIPDFERIKGMTFVSVNGAKRREIRTGLLEIVTEPAGLEIFVDGIKRPERTNATLELTEGKHHIELYLPSTAYRHSFTADIAAGRSLRQILTMRGMLQVESFWLRNGQKSAGPALEVYLNGQRVGRSHLRMSDLLAGTHQLEVRFENVTKSRRIEIRPDSPLHVNYSVIRQAAPPPKRGPDPGRVPI